MSQSRVVGAIYGFERDTYLRELDVEILSVGEEKGRAFALLDDTILFPEGGGQPSDRGWLADIAVVDVQRAGDKLRHFVAGPVEPGAARLVLDWERRYDHMQQHTAQHLLTSLALRRFGWRTRSFHIGPQTSDIELDCEPLSAEQTEALEEAVAEMIAEARRIRAYRVEPEEYASLEVRSRGLPAGHTGSIRLVEIEGVDLNTCGGTHVGSTSEVGMVKIVAAEAIRGGSRLQWVAGRRARRRLAAHESRCAQLRSLLDSGDDDLVSVLRLKLDQLGLAARARRQLEERLAGAIADQLLARSERRLVETHLEDSDAALLRRVAEIISERQDGRWALLTASGSGGALFAVVAGAGSGVDLQLAGRSVAERLAGRGGGADRIFQGKAGSLEHRRDAVDELSRLLG